MKREWFAPWQYPENQLNSLPTTSKKKAHFLALSFLLVISGGQIGCKNSKDDSLSKQISSMGQSISSTVPSLASEEFKKLFKIEYKVVKLEGNLTASTLQHQLSELGNDRWECLLNDTAFSDSPHLVCKRLPVGYLKLLFQFMF